MDNEVMHTQELNKLFEALSKAQSSIMTAIKDKNNPFYKTKYADLSSAWDGCREPLTTNGLSVIQTIEGTKEAMYLLTILGHSSGQWIKSKLPLMLAKTDPQSMGSVISYARRYALMAIVGICSDDDDGEANQKHVRQQQSVPQQPNIAPKKINKQQIEELTKLLAECPQHYQDRVWETLDKMKITSYDEINIDLFEKMKMAAIKTRDEYQASNLEENKEGE